MDAVLNDSNEFCQKNQNRKGKVRVVDLARLSAVCASQSGELVWTVEGKINSSGYRRFDLTVKGGISLTCQRCMEAFSFDLDSRAFVILADNEAEADEIEGALADDDPAEVIVWKEKTDLLVLVEDEILLALPLSPRHEVCPDVNRPAFGEKRESPFSVLRNLKIKKEEKSE